MKHVRSLIDHPVDGVERKPGDEFGLDELRAERNAARGLVEILGDWSPVPANPLYLAQSPEDAEQVRAALGAGKVPADQKAGAEASLAGYDAAARAESQR